jgi:hypothetical protein
MARVILGILFVLLASVGALAQSPPDAWDNLKQLEVGQKIEVVDMNLKSLKGRLVSVSEAAISIRTDKEEAAVERANVMRVSTPGGRRGHNALIGLGIGAAAGAAVITVAFATREVPEYAPQIAAGAIVWGGGIGAGIGAAFPGSRTIYRAEKPKSKPGP